MLQNGAGFKHTFLCVDAGNCVDAVEQNKVMEITVHRYASNSDKTRSIVMIDGTFECYGLEDAYHAEKIYAETRIPSGTYVVDLRTEGSIHPKYLQRFPDDHMGMLWFREVPNFTFCYAHIGNTELHTAGCLLLGAGVSVNGSLHSSELAYFKLYRKVVKAAIENALTITFIDWDME